MASFFFGVNCEFFKNCCKKLEGIQLLFNCPAKNQINNVAISLFFFHVTHSCISVCPMLIECRQDPFFFSVLETCSEIVIRIDCPVWSVLLLQFLEEQHQEECITNSKQCPYDDTHNEVGKERTFPKGHVFHVAIESIPCHQQNAKLKSMKKKIIFGFDCKAYHYSGHFAIQYARK